MQRKYMYKFVEPPFHFLHHVSVLWSLALMRGNSYPRISRSSNKVGFEDYFTFSSCRSFVLPVNHCIGLLLVFEDAVADNWSRKYRANTAETDRIRVRQL